MDEFFGSPGAVSDPSEDKFKNDFSTVSDVSLDSFAQTDRVNPRSMMTGIHRGVQYLGGKNIYSDSENRRIVTEDNSDKRVFLGKIGDGANDWGMKVSQEGVDVASATDSQLVFNSANNLFKIVDTGTATVPALGAAPTSDSFTSSSITIDTNITTTEPLAFFAYGKLTGGATLRALPFHQVYTDGAQGARIGAEWEVTSSVVAGELSLGITGRNYQNNTVDDLLVRWYVVRETIAVD